MGLIDVINAKNEEDKKFLENVEKAIRDQGLPIIIDKKSGNPLWISTRELRLRYIIPIKNIEKFFEGLKNGKLLGTKCEKCGKVYFPPQRDCPECMNSNLQYIELSNEGELLTYTVINVKPSSFSHYPDYIVGVVRLKEGVNVVGWVNIDPKEVRVGMKVRLIVSRRNPEGYYTYEFVKKRE